MNKLFSQSTDRKYKDKETRDSAFMSYRLTDELTLNYAYSQLNSHFKAYKYDGTTGGWTKLSKNYFYKDDQQTGSLYLPVIRAASVPQFLIQQINSEPMEVLTAVRMNTLIHGIHRKSGMSVLEMMF